MERSWGYGSELRNRQENQDCIGVFDFAELTLAVVCDGMGGHVGGAQASSLCVRAVHDFIAANLRLPDQELLRLSLEEANQVIYEAARKNHRLQGMGTTAVIALLRRSGPRAGELTVAHVGDSRAYLVRSGESPRALTRDHTMVNLFVDAELLSPEDAATHPEAHVLSRSIGVERAVDVEIEAPFPLSDGDVVMLCSDGLHNVIEEVEIGDVDWTDPQGAVRELLDVVAARGGDDNASAVALRAGVPVAAMEPPTPPPEPMSLEDILARSGSIDMFADETRAAATIPGVEPVENPKAPAPPPRAPPEPEPQYVVFEEPEEPKQDDLRARVRRENRTSTALPIGRIAAFAAILLLPAIPITLFLLFRSQATVEPVAPEAAPAVVEPPVEVAPAPAPEPVFWQASVPEAPDRADFRPTRHTTSPPRSPEQITAVTAARARQCGASFDAIHAGMAYSPDHAALYDTAWDCFDRHDQRVLAGARARTVDEIGALMRHLEGDPTERPRNPADEALPPWGRPALDGIEYRMERYATTGEKVPFSNVIQERIGTPQVADSLAADLAIEAQLAAALAGAPDPAPQVVDWWARRVFVTATALRGPIGEIVGTHRPEVKAQVEAWLVQATTPPAVGPDGKPGSLPAPVAAAVAAAQTGVVVAAPKPGPKGPRPQRPQEPTLEDLQDPGN